MKHSAAEPQPNWRTAPPRAVSGQHSAVSSPLSPGVSGVFHNRGSVHRPCPPTQIRSPETTGEPFFSRKGLTRIRNSIPPAPISSMISYRPKVVPVLSGTREI